MRTLTPAARDAMVGDTRSLKSQVGDRAGDGRNKGDLSRQVPYTHEVLTEGPDAGRAVLLRGLTLDEVGRLWEMTRKRARQVELRALSNLAHGLMDLAQSEDEVESAISVMDAWIEHCENQNRNRERYAKKRRERK